jgi:hypothetical protein
MVTKRQIKELDAKFEQTMRSARMEFADSEFSPDKAAARREKANTNDLDFCKIYFPKLFDSPFNEIHRTVAEWQEGDYTLSGSRRFGKSAFCYVGKVIKHIALGMGGIVNISLYDEDMAKERTASLSRIIQKNRLLCYDYNIEIIQNPKGHHIFKCDNGQTTMVATSVRQGLRALMDDDFDRFTLAIADDLYSRQTVDSEKHIEKVYNFVVSELWGQMEPGALSITIGNAIKEDAPIVKLREEHTGPTGHHFSLPAMNAEQTKSNWPERWSREALLAFKAKLPYDVWMGDYMDEPVEVGDVMNPNWINFVNLNLIDIIASISVADPAHGESPSSCDKGLATVGIDEKKKIYVLDMYLRNEGYMLFFDYCQRLREEFSYKALLFENDFAQWGHAAPYYQDWLVQNKRPLPIVQFLSSENETEFRSADKESRIMNLVHPHQTGQLLYSEKLKHDNDFKKYKDQNYLRFGQSKSAKLDGLDALASAYIMIWSYIETGAFKPLKQRTWNTQQMKSWFH